ncbi:MAG: anti-sigma factor [Planctomycetota bacterium]|jgi:anti-sigma factor RsiW
MNCKFAREMIALWVGNDLTPAEAEAVNEHVEDCPDCQQHVEALLNSSDVLVAFNAATLQTHRDSVWPQLEQQIAQSATEPSPTLNPRRSVLRSLGMASVAALSFCVAILPDYLRDSITTEHALPVFVDGVSNVAVQGETATPLELPDNVTRVYPLESWLVLERLTDDDRPRPNIEHYGGL